MNFIKKKLKGHKKDDEEEEYEKAMYEQSLHPQTQDQKGKNTEEWQFFQQLSMKVQDTVQKTQTTLNKLKDTRPEDNLDMEDNFFGGESNLLSKETPPYGSTKVLRAPPRPPPPPAGGKSAFTPETDFDSNFCQVTLPRGPPRPPPPGSSDASFGLDSSAFHGTLNKNFASPSRPPPPSVGKVENTRVSENLSFNEFTSDFSQAETKQASFSLLDEFGFKSEPVPVTNTNVQDLLFLDDKDEVDPFDTSFVDANISSVNLERRESKTLARNSDKSFNPFSSSAVSNSVSNVKPATNPFFSGGTEDHKQSVENNFHNLSHNPFSNKEPAFVSSTTNDLFGITLEQSSNISDLPDNLFDNNQGITNTLAESEYPSQYINSAFSLNDSNEIDVADDINSVQIIPQKGISSEANFYNSDIGEENFSVFDTKTTSNSDVFGLSEKQDSTLLWNTDSMKKDILMPESTTLEEPIKAAELDKPTESINVMDSFNRHNVDESFSNLNTLSSAIDSQEMLQLDTHNDAALNTTYSKDNVSDVSDTSEAVNSKFQKRDSIPNSQLTERKTSIPNTNLAERRKSIPSPQLAERRESIPSPKITERRESIQSPKIAERRESIQSPKIAERRESFQSPKVGERRESIQSPRISERRESIQSPKITERRESIQSPKIAERRESIQSPKVAERRGSIPSSKVSDRRESISNSMLTEKRESIPNSMLTEKRESIPNSISTEKRESISSSYMTEKRSSIPNAKSTEKRPSIPNSKLEESENIPNSQYNKTGENILKDDPKVAFVEDFSKPFNEENSQNTFLFKTGSDQQPDLDFDAFAAKFENAKDKQGADAFDPFMSSKRAPTLKKLQDNYKGFDSMDEFDPFKVSNQNRMVKEPSRDSFDDYDTEVDFSVVIKPKVKDSSDVKLSTIEAPKLLPPPKTPTKAFDTPISRFNPFDKDFLDNSEISKVAEKTFETIEVEEESVPALGEAGIRKSESVETPVSPLFDEDTSQPLEIFPKPYDKEGWEMVLRQPNKKKLTGNRFWKKIFVKLSENSVLQLFNKADDKLPFQELPLQACYSMSEVGAQQYDQYGKIFTVKLQYKFYRERVGVRPGQISKVTQGQVTSMGDVAKLGLPLQHSPQTSQLLKLGSQYYSDMKVFIQELEDALFHMSVHRDRVLTYKTEEVQVIAQDEFYVEQSKTGHIDKQLARVRIFFLAFITGMPSVEVGLNDIIRQGKEVVGRYDIIPVVTEEWIRLEDCEFHSCVIQDEFYKNRVIKFHPPDACLFELLRFRIRPPKNRELPLQVRVFMTVSNTSVEIRSDILVPGYSSRKQGQVPCENIQIRFPVPECWIYLFRTEKHFRYGSKKSTARRPGKIKGLERIIGAAQNLDPSLIEVSAGQAKYEHVFHAVVWRIPRLPKEGQGAYTQQLFLLRTELTSFDQIPESFEQYVDVEFTMPATYVSHTTVRSVSVTNPIPPEKYVRYISKHEYKVEIDFKNSTDEIDNLINTPNVSVPISTTPAVQESTEDEDKDDSD